MFRKIKQVVAEIRAHRELMRKMENLIDPTFLDRATSGR